MAKAEKLGFGHFVYDTEQRLLSCEGRIVAASPKVLETLEILLQARGRIVSKGEFMEALWPSTFVEESNLTQNIFVLRRILGQTEAGEAYVETLPRRGYRLSVPVESLPEEPLPEKPLPEDSVASGYEGNPLALRRRKTDLQDGTGEAFSVAVLGDVEAGREPSRGEQEDPAVAGWQQAQPMGRQRIVWAAGGVGALALAAFAAFAVYTHTPRPMHLTVTETRRLTQDGVPKTFAYAPVALGSDGRRLFFTERRDNSSLLAEVALEGGDVRTRAAPQPDSAVVDYSPRTRTLLLGSAWTTADDRPILAQREGDVARPVGELTGHDASFSPAGDRIAFAHGRYLNVANADGSNLRPVVAGGGIVYWPRWSADGTRLRFTENHGSNESQIWEVNANGSNLHQLLLDTEQRNQACCGSWSGDGRFFFYVAVGPASSTVWVLPGDSEGSRKDLPTAIPLMAGAAYQWRGPLPDAAGHRFWVVGSDSRGELVRFDPKTREPKPYLGGISAEGVSFSPDAAWIAYTAYPEGTLWRSRADGTERTQLTRPPLVARFPRWSPDGRTIAFLAGQAGSAWHLYLVAVATGAVQPLLNEAANQGVASWSPDGTQIAFGRLLDFGVEHNPNLTVEIYDLQLGTHKTLHGSQGLWTPRWSPDGRYFAAVTQDNRCLRLFDTRTGLWSDLAHVSVNDMVWDPSSRFVYFDTVFGSDPALYRVSIPSGKLETWASLRGLQRTGFFAPWIGITPDGAPLLLRDRAIEEVYQVSLAETR